MNCSYFHPSSTLSKNVSLPEKFNFPTNYIPHTVAIKLCEEVKKYIRQLHSPTTKGRMYGVLIAKDVNGELGYLAAFSGQEHPHDDFFVPPIYNRLHEEGFYLKNERKLSAINKQILQYHDNLQLKKALRLKEQCIDLSQKEITAKAELNKQEKIKRNKLRESYLARNEQQQLALLIKESQTQKSELNKLKRKWKNRLAIINSNIKTIQDNITRLKEERQILSQNTQKKLFESYKVINKNGEAKSILFIFQEQLGKEPPAGTGDCCAPKLLNFAFLHQLEPITMAEFWWGKSPKNEVRKHLQFYPVCRGKCEPLLNHMLDGIPVEDNPLIEQIKTEKSFKIIYEDDDIAVIEKPHNLLSVPGIITQNSVLEQAKIKLNQPTGPIIVHRLDWATSGLMVLSKNKKSYHNLQNQFLNKKVFKRYTALIAGNVNQKSGEINLPLRTDLNDRPKQMVCKELGKKALTQFKVVKNHNNITRIHLFPITGRTHQLRVHMAHHLGLNCPIVGDNLYGNPAERMFLQADQLSFYHPTSHQKLFFEMPAEF